MDQSNNTRWKAQWWVASASGDKDHKVSLDQNNQYFCDCLPFRRNRTCKHIDEVEGGGGKPIGVDLPPEPSYSFAIVRQVEKQEDGSLFIPQVPFGEDHILYTIIFDLMRYGLRWSTICKMYELKDRQITPEHVRLVVETHGRKICGPWQKDVGYVGYEFTFDGVAEKEGCQNGK